MVLKRFGVSIPEDLLDEFDNLVKEREYVGRSEAIRDAMRCYLSESQWEAGEGSIVASLNIVYSHKPKVMAELIKIQHVSEAHVISTTHVHVSKSHCLEVITMTGSKESILSLTNSVAGISGIDYAKLIAFVLPKEIDLHHGHNH